MEIDDIEPGIKVNPAKYRARIYSSNPARVENESGDDDYTPEIWPDADLARTVLNNKFNCNHRNNGPDQTCLAGILMKLDLITQKSVNVLLHHRADSKNGR